MIAGLYGQVVENKADGQVVLAVGPVMLEVFMPLSQACSMQLGTEAQIFTHMHLSTSSDSLKLYGFSSKLARDLFATLITGSGVGPKVALALLDVGESALVNAVREGDEKVLTSVKGVGPKLAKKIILELGDKVAREFHSVASETSSVGQSAVTSYQEDAVLAVVSLGYGRPQAMDALKMVTKEYDGDDVTILIRKMLSRLSG